MQPSCIVLLVLAVTVNSIEFKWDFGNWSPIPGKCATCQRGRVIELERNGQRHTDGLIAQESQPEKRQTKSGRNLSLVPAKMFSYKDNPIRQRTNRVQLVYIPEGSINDLRQIQLAKVSENSGQSQFRSERDTPLKQFLSRQQAQDLETSDSQLSFREISPRRPTALIAERGKEREAHEQIQLLEAALHSQPQDVREGELPRVFIAPTHLPPPPGYVKIPLLPNKNHVNSRKTLPGTFLTSEIHKQLPPGFVQVPLPERVAQLSHSIPFVNPNSNLLAPSNRHKVTGVDQKQKSNSQTLRSDQEFGSQPRTQSSLSGRQHFNAEAQPIQPNERNQEFNRGLPAQQHNRGQIPIPVQQVLQNVKQVQPAPQNFATQRNPNNSRGRARQQHTIRNHQIEPQQDQNFIPIPQTHSNTQETLVGTPRGHLTANTPSTQGQPQNFNQEPPRQRVVPISNEQNQGQQSNFSNNIRQVEEKPETASPNNIQQPSFKGGNQFFEVGSPVIGTSDSFDDYTSFDNPDFDPSLDFGQDFNTYDTQDFEVPNIINEPVNNVQSSPPLEEESPAQKSLKESKIENTPSSHISPSLQSEPIKTNDGEVVTSSQDEFATTESTTIEESLRLSPKRIETLSTFPASDVLSTTAEYEEVTEVPESLNIIPTTHTSRRIPLRPINSRVETVTETTTRTVPTSRNHARRRLRPGNPRGRGQNLLRNRLKQNEIEETPRITTFSSTDYTDNARESVDTFTTQKPTTLSTSIPAVTVRPRFNINRRRRPFQVDSNTVPTTTSPTNSITNPESSTLFPPFSVAKRLKERNEVSSSPQLETRRRQHSSVLRERFGSRIRPRGQQVSENSGDATTVQNENDSPAQAETPRRRRLRQRVRGPGKGPLGKRRRRILSRVRKVNPDRLTDNLNDNNAVSENELRGAESAKISISQNPVVPVSDPITQTLDLINHKGADDPNLELFKVEETQEQVSVVAEPPTTLNTDSSPKTDQDKNIFSMFSLEKTPEIVETATDADLSPSVNLNDSPLKTIEEGYVNDEESSPSQSFSDYGEPRSILEPLEGKALKHEETIPSGETTSSPFNSLFNSISLSPKSDDTPAPFPTSDSAPVESKDENLDHAPSQSTPEKEETLIASHDNSNNLPPENTLKQQDNLHEDDVPAETPLDNEDYLGSSAQIVYAVAVSDTPSEQSPENEFSTSSPSNQEETVTEPSTTTEASGSETLSSTLAAFVAEVNEVTEMPEETTTLLENADIDYVSELESVDTMSSSGAENMKKETTFQSDPVSEQSPDSKMAEGDKESMSKIEPRSESTVLNSDLPNSDIPNKSEDSEPVKELPLNVNNNEESSTVTTETESKASAADVDQSTGTEKDASEIVIESPSEEKEPHIEESASPSIESKEPSKIASEHTFPVEAKSTPEEPEVAPETQTEHEDQLPPTSNPDTVPGSFLDTFFSKARETKSTGDKAVEEENTVIGKSTVTEVRSSIPVICIEDSCVHGTGIRR